MIFKDGAEPNGQDLISHMRQSHANPKLNFGDEVEPGGSNLILEDERNLEHTYETEIDELDLISHMKRS